LYYDLDFTNPYEPKLIEKKKQLAEKKSVKHSDRVKSEPTSDNRPAKVITAVLSGAVRPRKATRVLLTKRNSATLDQVLEAICDSLKVESLNVKRLYTLKGREVKHVSDFYKKDSYFIAGGNEQLYRRDFNLDPDEATMIFANELMKPFPCTRILKLYNKFTSSKQAKGSRKEKIDNEITDFEIETGSGEYPEDLMQNYEIGNIIGEGQFAVVRECTDINTRILFALKIIDLRKCKGKEFMIDNELKILRKAKHPNIIKLVEEYRSKTHLYLIMELLKYGDLLDAITNSVKYTEKDASGMVYNLASAINYLHSNSIVHRDIKLENILIQKHSNGLKSLKLGDFGLAIELKESLNQICGSPYYVAPEVLYGRDYGLEVDVWSLGVVTYILLCGFAPFRGDTEDDTYKQIKHGTLEFPSPYWDNITVNAKDLISRMLDRDQKSRIKASEILTHQWLNEDPLPTLQSSRSTFTENHKNNFHEDVIRNLSHSFRRTTRDNQSMGLVTRTALDKQSIKLSNTPLLERVDVNNEDI